MKKIIFSAKLVVVCACMMLASACSDHDVDPNLGPYDTIDTTDTSTISPNYDEQYRPQIHYTPAANWINDPNGLVYANGTYHMFYQYNPQGNSWGNMSWGHATSTDLVHWKEVSVVLTRDELGDIFSGSAVVDSANTAGFGAGAIVAIYTSADTYQQQSLAYSTDGIKFTKYSGNPIIKSTSADFRDPKVFWYAAGKKWVMELATGSNHSIELWTSTDLKKWTQMSTFTSSLSACNQGQWECPDLFPLTYKSQQKWIQLVSTNPGGHVTGSSTMYFIGDFNGTTFTADDSYSYPLWLDYGADTYANATWNNINGRRIAIGWMNNWNYAGSVPTHPWRSAMTLPRELSLIDYNGKPILSNKVIPEISSIAGDWRNISDGALGNADAYEVQVTLPTSVSWTITLSNDQGQEYNMTYDAADFRIIADRGSDTGSCSFSTGFAIPSINMPLNTDGDNVTLNIFIDRSSVETATDTGSSSMTNILFPTNIYNHISLSGADGSIKVRSMKSIWK